MCADEIKEFLEHWGQDDVARVDDLRWHVTYYDPEETKYTPAHMSNHVGIVSVSKSLPNPLCQYFIYNLANSDAFAKHINDHVVQWISGITLVKSGGE